MCLGCKSSLYLLQKLEWLSVASLVAQTVKRLPTMWETPVWSLGQKNPLEKEMSTHSSTLVWKIPWTEEPGRLQSMGLQRIGHDWVTFFSLSFLTHTVVHAGYANQIDNRQAYHALPLIYHEVNKPLFSGLFTYTRPFHGPGCVYLCVCMCVCVCVCGPLAVCSYGYVFCNLQKLRCS